MHATYYFLYNQRIFLVSVPRQLQAVPATIEQRRHQPEPDFGRSEHNPSCIAATDQVIPDLVIKSKIKRNNNYNDTARQSNKKKVDAAWIKAWTSN